MSKLIHVGLVVACTITMAVPVQAQSRRVAVVVLEGKGFRTRARVGIALRNELSSKGRLVTNPAQVFDTSGATLSDVAAARRTFKAAVKLYDGLSFKKARARFVKAVEAFRAVVARGADSKDYVKALHYLGASALYDNARDKAIRTFAEAAVFSPEDRPDEAVFSPDVLKAFDEAKAAGAATCSMRILSSPAAEVRVNGQVRGVSKLKLPGLKPGRYLVRFERAGYEADAQWISVEQGASAEVRTELKALPQLAIYRQTLTAVRQELKGPKPGPAVQRLMKSLSVGSVIIVGRQGRAVSAGWAEGGFWVKRNKGTVAKGGAGAFAGQLLAASGVTPPSGGCNSASDCSAGQVCRSGNCMAGGVVSQTPIYKKWWFWTIIGAAVAGGTVGVVLGTQSSTEDWRAVLKPGGVQ
jgi:hypothetical protein